MPTADPPPNMLDIPCGYCGSVVSLAISRLPGSSEIACPECDRPIALYLAGLCDDIHAASHALARFRSGRRQEEPG